MNECCISIGAYHNIHNKKHGNASLENFIYEQQDNTIKIVLRNPTNHVTHVDMHSDYDQFFSSYYEYMIYKNKHFDKFYNLYKNSLMKSIT